MCTRKLFAVYRASEYLFNSNYLVKSIPSQIGIPCGDFSCEIVDYREIVESERRGSSENKSVGAGRDVRENLVCERSRYSVRLNYKCIIKLFLSVFLI